MRPTAGDQLDRTAFTRARDSSTSRPRLFVPRNQSSSSSVTFCIHKIRLFTNCTRTTSGQVTPVPRGGHSPVERARTAAMRHLGDHPWIAGRASPIRAVCRRAVPSNAAP